jgi:hypothetical protein
MLAKKRFIILGVVVVLLLVGVGSYAVIAHQLRTEKVVVVNQTIAPGAILMVQIPLSNFTVESKLVSQVPTGAYIFTTQDALACYLNYKLNDSIMRPGYILRGNDIDLHKNTAWVGALGDYGKSPYECPSGTTP